MDSAHPCRPRPLALPDAEVYFYPQAFTPAESDGFLAALLGAIAWRQEAITLFGKTHNQPRLMAWHGDPEAIYTYSKLRLAPQPWIPPLLDIRARVEAICDQTFNSVLLNLYRDGTDSMGWHSDDEPELGPNPVIASVSFGQTRRFRMRHRQRQGCTAGLDLTHGSVLVMAGPTQHHWQHHIPKTRRPLQSRINLTFRAIAPRSANTNN
jgi:alkylated DNA repair dioxygenase AlkB